MSENNKAIPIKAIMPGRIMFIATTVVVAGAVVFTMDAMKMEHSHRAFVAGTFVAAFMVGAEVASDSVIGYFFPAEVEPWGAIGTVTTVLSDAVVYTMESMKMQSSLLALATGVFVAVAAIGVIVKADDIIGWLFHFPGDENALAGCGADSEDDGSH